jgi:hypothetical protein
MVIMTLLVCVAGRAKAGPLNPLDFASLGDFPTLSGGYYIDTSGSNPTISGPGGLVLTGVVFNGIAVFDFNSITVGANQLLGGTGSLPVALLSRGDVVMNGTIDASAPYGYPNIAGLGGYRFGPGTGSDGGTDIVTGNITGAGGGGYGGSGGNGAGIPPPGGAGGTSYGDLAIALQGGSGGGTFFGHYSVVYGGAGGGAVEIGAVGGITIGGKILANGSNGNLNGSIFGSGGGSGGGIYLHGDSVALSSSSVLSAFGGSAAGSGGGGGGRVLIQTGPGGFDGSIGSINVSGGSNGTAGVITITAVPEPASLVLLGIGLLGVLSCARHARPPASV